MARPKVVIRLFSLTMIVFIVSSTESKGIERELTLQRLHERCAKINNMSNPNLMSNNDYADLHACFEYLSGLSNALSINCKLYLESGIDIPQTMMSSDDSTMGALAQGFVNWSTNHPELWKEHRMIAVQGISQIFPCRG